MIYSATIDKNNQYQLFEVAVPSDAIGNNPVAPDNTLPVDTITAGEKEEFVPLAVVGGRPTKYWTLIHKLSVSPMTKTMVNRGFFNTARVLTSAKMVEYNRNTKMVTLTDRGKAYARQYAPYVAAVVTGIIHRPEDTNSCCSNVNGATEQGGTSQDTAGFNPGNFNLEAFIMSQSTNM